MLQIIVILHSHSTAQITGPIFPTQTNVFAVADVIMQAATCQFKHQQCFFCHTKGHTSRVCRKRAKSMKSSGGRVHHAGEIEDHADSDSDVYHIYRFGIKRVNPIFEQLLINGTPVRIEVDTGASLTIRSEKRFHEAYPSNP